MSSARAHTSMAGVTMEKSVLARTGAASGSTSLSSETVAPCGRGTGHVSCQLVEVRAAYKGCGLGSTTGDDA